MQPDFSDISSVIHRDIPAFAPGEQLLQEMGGEQGIATLVEGFYHAMDTLPEAQKIRLLYDEDLTDAKAKLAMFLQAWMAGQTPSSTHTPPEDWTHLTFGMAEKQAWLACMQKALDVQGLDSLFVRYLMVQFTLLAETCRNQP
ncbi:globin [Photobacterium aphoticum]|uniref:Hemoglobin-like protein HbO n=1 Tax=Photobacterium aphoticum TaxID=754436 RepID=A0A0J1GMR0_9GAMM|nr:hypothetical protein [Photobacterium aphoticum]KLV01045.1 hypothetical protein ABT58_09555 [Photobacterium aphoticum]PSU58400.1 globin [Photobacterium aphoticum]GHA37436.1 hypothetical protein GCM10007086_08400 [Photobacterium aphoticum]